jgi:hypothetical protein
MIDVAVEPLITLSQAADLVPRRRRGRKTAVATIYRWASCGVRGTVLETLQVGGSRCTSVRALQRFFDRLSGGVGTPSRPVTSRDEGRRAKAAGRALDLRWRPKKKGRSRGQPERPHA